MLDAMKTHEVIIKLKEKLGKYERLCMIKMENFCEIEKCENSVILSEGSFGTHIIK